MLLLFALSLGSAISAIGQANAAAPAAPQVDWKALTPQIQEVLGDPYNMCNRSSRISDIIQSGDITGDGVVTAIVAYCRTDVYTSDVALMRIEDGKPVLARFRDTKGKPFNPTFQTGASIKSGEGVKLLRARHAVYDIQWHIDKAMKMDNCTVQAYVWTPANGTFDQNPAVSKEIGTSECTRLGQQLDEQTSQFAQPKKHHVW
jgi:hypothetical protein